MELFGSHRALIGLGSNLSGPLGEPVDYIEAALACLGDTEDMDLLRCSGLYQSSPWGNQDQPAFINAVAEVHWFNKAHRLLEALLQIEEDLGRERSEKWGPRQIDLDLLSFDDRQIHSKKLIVPHPHMHERAFVLVPLLELDPDFVIPDKGRAQGYLDALEQNHDRDQWVEPI